MEVEEWQKNVEGLGEFITRVNTRGYGGACPTANKFKHGRLELPTASSIELTV